MTSKEQKTICYADTSNEVKGNELISKLRKFPNIYKAWQKKHDDEIAEIAYLIDFIIHNAEYCHQGDCMKNLLTSNYL